MLSLRKRFSYHTFSKFTCRTFLRFVTRSLANVVLLHVLPQWKVYMYEVVIFRFVYKRGCKIYVLWTFQLFWFWFVQIGLENDRPCPISDRYIFVWRSLYMRRSLVAVNILRIPTKTVGRMKTFFIVAEGAAGG